MKFIQPLPANPETWAILLNHNYNDFVWLDSPNHTGQSLLAFDARQTKNFSNESSSNAFKKFFENFSFTESQKPSSLFFEGGWIGYCSYECYAFNPLIQQKPKDLKPYPLSVWKYYDTFILYQNRKLFFCSDADNAETIYKDLLEAFKKTSQKSKKNPNINQSNSIKTKTSKNLYDENFSKIQDSLKRGDYFELNFSIEWQSDFKEDAFFLYQHLRTVSPAPMMSYFSWPEVKILSASPECFFKIDPSGNIETHPIKGTIQKSKNKKTDDTYQKNLTQSQKDRAELLMVTDMLRNDLGRICKPGSIQTPRLFDLKSFSHYHHLVALIKGALKTPTNLFDIFCALFPGGSITGAPKIEVMKHIQKLENRSRGIYTGAIGYLSHSGQVQWSIPIRTLTIFKETLEFATGSGIVIDSLAEKEYEECLLKAQGILQALNQSL